MAVQENEKKAGRRKAGLIIGVVAAVIAAAIGAGTHAAFTDTETGPGGPGPRAHSTWRSAPRATRPCSPARTSPRATPRTARSPWRTRARSRAR
ncbi:SipW-dependent-type signal peptide-containing protein [Pseudonocardia xishanensis]|uniref:SipW-dependent-type signal peptide-containing protein n=1 Tax=Pseudonocardia xishanensis TaxID=630995 RepID=UPI003CD0BF2F